MRASKPSGKSDRGLPAGTSRAGQQAPFCASVATVARDLARRSGGNARRQQSWRTKAPPKHHQSRGGQGPRVQVGSLSEVCENGPSQGTIETHGAQCNEGIARRAEESGSVRIARRANRQMIVRSSSEVPCGTRRSEAPGRGGDLPLTAVLAVPEVGGGSEVKSLQTRNAGGLLGRDETIPKARPQGHLHRGELGRGRPATAKHMT